MKRLFCSICAIALGLHLYAQEVISLAGKWDFKPQYEDELSIQTVQFDDYVMLPGSMLTNNKGQPVTIDTQWTGSLYDSSFYFNPYMEKYRNEGNMKFPFFLTPNTHYTGVAWYRKQVVVPKDWSNRRITLFLERAHIETKAYINGNEIGGDMSLSTPHRYDVTDYLKFGEVNEIAIRVYNGIENVCVGQDSHSVTDQTQGNWNGIIGRIELQAQWKQLNIRRVCITPHAANRQVYVKVELENNVPKKSKPHHVTLNIYSSGRYLKPMTAVAKGQKVEFVVDLGQDALLWDEFQPNLYKLVVQAGEDVYETKFGLRDIAIKGRQFYINDRPLYLRGTVENCCFPETGYPPTDEDEWMRIFRKCKEFGLNHMRFHSYCPPEAAFSAADKMGFYLQPEGPSWPNHGVRLRRGMKIDRYLLEESKRIVDEYGHHPSFVMMAAGNEPAGDWVSYCNDWVKEMKQYDPTKVYAGASVGGGWAWDNGSEFHVKGGARGLDGWNKHAPSSDDDYYSGIEFPRNYKDSLPNQTPIITHEKGQWCAFPDFKELPQYTGAYKAGNLEIFRDLLHDNGMASQAENFLMASGRLQTLCYKFEVERNLRTKDYAGFQLLSLNDYSGQGTALVGPLNVHWREKGYCTAYNWTEFCSPLVPLARFPKFVYTSNETLTIPVEAYNALSADVDDVEVYCYITDESQQVYACERLMRGTLPIGKNIPLGVFTHALDFVTEPTKFTLQIQLFPTKSVNRWDFWVYPETLEPSEHPSVAEFTELTDEALSILKKGGTVLLTAAGRVTLGSDVKQTYLPVFWNTSWFKMRPPHTTGAYINTQHPLFKYDFPTDDWSNLNWWELLNRAQVMNLMELPADYQPPIQPIDTWHVSRKLGMLIEAKVEKGRLLMTTMDITNDLEHRPVARQMRHAILAYMQSEDFQPTLTFSPDVIQDFYTKQAPPVDMFTNDSPDELKPKLTN